MDNKDAWLALSFVNRIGNTLAKRVVDHFGSATVVFDQSISTLKEVRGISEQLASQILDAPNSPAFKQERQRITDNGIALLTIDDEAYPPRLKNIAQPPVLLYVKGHLKQQDQLSIAIVGSRTCTFYGKKMAEYFGLHLAEMGFSIVSGLARGIDSYAHLGAYAHEPARLIGVLGNGIGYTYPKESKDLYKMVAERGALVSEFHYDATPSRDSFPQRNRIISGLSLGVLIVEAPEKSGALITADFAAEQGRDVFAIPGRADSYFCRGTNNLIKTGAKLTTCVEDIINDLSSQLYHLVPKEKMAEWEKIFEHKEDTPRPHHLPDKVKLAVNEQKKVKTRTKQEQLQKPAQQQIEIPVDLSPMEKAILELLNDNPLHLDTIAEKVNKPVHEISGALLQLELKALVVQMAGKLFIRG